MIQKLRKYVALSNVNLMWLLRLVRVSSFIHRVTMNKLLIEIMSILYYLFNVIMNMYNKINILFKQALMKKLGQNNYIISTSFSDLTLMSK